jgi:hypothetical protein
MTTASTTLSDPDRIARKLFVMTMFGALAFFTIIMFATHYFPAELGPSDSVAPLVRLVPSK